MNFLLTVNVFEFCMLPNHTDNYHNQDLHWVTFLYSYSTGWGCPRETKKICSQPAHQVTSSQIQLWSSACPELDQTNYHLHWPYNPICTGCGKYIITFREIKCIICSSYDQYCKYIFHVKPFIICNALDCSLLEDVD